MISRLSTLVLVAALVGVVVAGCGGGDNGNDQASSGYLDPAKHVHTQDFAGLNINLDGTAPLGGPAPITTQFRAKAEKTDGDVVYRWRFDDGATSLEQNPKHTFTRPGNYLVTVDTRDSKGNSRINGAYIVVWPKKDWARPGISNGTLKSRQVNLQRLTLARQNAVIAQVHADQARALANLQSR